MMTYITLYLLVGAGFAFKTCDEIDTAIANGDLQRDKVFISMSFVLHIILTWPRIALKVLFGSKKEQPED